MPKPQRTVAATCAVLFVACAALFSSVLANTKDCESWDHWQDSFSDVKTLPTRFAVRVASQGGNVTGSKMRLFHFGKGSSSIFFNGRSGENVQSQLLTDWSTALAALSRGQDDSMTLRCAEESHDGIVHDLAVPLGSSTSTFISGQFGSVWIPQDRFRPGDTVKGFALLRCSLLDLSDGSIRFDFCDRVPGSSSGKPLSVTLGSHSSGPITVRPLGQLIQNKPMVMFEIETDKHLPVGTDYYLQLGYSDGSRVLAEHPINIIHFDKADIILQATPKHDVASGYMPGSNYKWSLRATYLDGSPVSKNGKVRISCDREAAIGCASVDWLSSAEEEIVLDEHGSAEYMLTLKASASGEHKIEFEAFDSVGRKSLPSSPHVIKVTRLEHVLSATFYKGQGVLVLNSETFSSIVVVTMSTDHGAKAVRFAQIKPNEPVYLDLRAFYDINHIKIESEDNQFKLIVQYEEFQQAPNPEEPLRALRPKTSLRVVGLPDSVQSGSIISANVSLIGLDDIMGTIKSGVLAVADIISPRGIIDGVSFNMSRRSNGDYEGRFHYHIPERIWGPIRMEVVALYRDERPTAELPEIAAGSTLLSTLDENIRVISSKKSVRVIDSRFWTAVHHPAQAATGETIEVSITAPDFVTIDQSAVAAFALVDERVLAAGFEPHDIESKILSSLELPDATLTESRAHHMPGTLHPLAVYPSVVTTNSEFPLLISGFNLENITKVHLFNVVDADSRRECEILSTQGCCVLCRANSVHLQVGSLHHVVVTSNGKNYTITDAIEVVHLDPAFQPSSGPVPLNIRLPGDTPGLSLSSFSGSTCAGLLKHPQLQVRSVELRHRSLADKMEAQKTARISAFIGSREIKVFPIKPSEERFEATVVNDKAQNAVSLRACPLGWYGEYAECDLDSSIEMAQITIDPKAENVKLIVQKHGAGLIMFRVNDNVTIISEADYLLLAIRGFHPIPTHGHPWRRKMESRLGIMFDAPGANLAFAPMMAGAAASTFDDGEMIFKRDLHLQVMESDLGRKMAQRFIEIIRTDFSDAVLVGPISLAPGKDGITQEIVLPDSVTKYRLYSIIAGVSRFAVNRTEIIVKNPIFSATQNPPTMVLDEKIKIATTIENQSDRPLRGITITIESLNENAVIGQTEHKLDSIGARDSTVVWWEIEAKRVGDVQMRTHLSCCDDKFRESSLLQKPLRILPPGIPTSSFSRSLVEPKSTWLASFNVTGQEAFTLATLNVLLQPSLAILEGVESLASYPYGCCEQTSATTIPNAVAYAYLKANNKLSSEIEQKLITNMKAGLSRYETQFRNAQTGGFGLWSGEETSVFHTSLAISVIGKLRPFIAVPEQIFSGARSYLASKQQEDGSYAPGGGVHQMFPSTMSLEAMTAYVAHAQALGGLLDNKALLFLYDKFMNGETIKQDPTVLALFLDAISLSKADKQLDPKLLNVIPDLVANLLSLGEIKSVNNAQMELWSKGSSLSSEVETTSYVLAALAHSGVYNAQVQKAFELGSTYLMNTRSSSGWFTTRDTLWACYALGEIASSLGSTSFVDSELSVLLNGEPIRTVSFKSDEDVFVRQYELRNVFMDTFKQGENVFALQFNGGKGHGVNAVLEVKKWTRSQPTQQLPISLKQDATKGTNNRINVAYELHNNGDSALDALMLEQRIPTGFEINDATLKRLRASGAIPAKIEHSEVSTKKSEMGPLVGLFISKLEARSTVRFELEFEPSASTLSSSVYIEGLNVMPMYSPATQSIFPRVLLA